MGALKGTEVMGAQGFLWTQPGCAGLSVLPAGQQQRASSWRTWTESGLGVICNQAPEQAMGCIVISWHILDLFSAILMD